MYLITGGAGFIGSNIAAALEAQGRGPIVICDRLHEGIKWRNIAKRELVDIVHPDELWGFLEDDGEELEAVIHMGAISATTETNADLIFKTNFRLTMALWHWCAGMEVPFIYASSAATYGDGARGFDDDPDLDALAALRPLNAYGWSKHLTDRRIMRLLAEGGEAPPQWAGLKFFNVYGPNEGHKGGQKSVVAHIHPVAAAGGRAQLFQSHRPDYADGGQLRDFVWVGDCVDVVLWLLDNPEVSGLFNCGTGKARSFADLAAAVYAALGREAEVDYVPTPEQIRDKYQYYTQANMDRLRAAGYGKPFTSLEDGVARYVRDYLERDDPCA
ncbi:MAG: ADP-glyceromanno-heptose 6-epimerase [Hyphomicrobiales bacterium]|nr:ADP-glyceromanno-heptose 6-epimerase [Hyphomicrobiales bacterium]MCP5371947.1 ADP-glyceromanno-heptose 6-epimerase [Hyphomicrobiales bacterium]